MRNQGKNMLIPTIIVAVLAIVLLIIGYNKGEGQHLEGLNFALDLLIRVTPIIIFAFIAAGMVRALIPKEILSEWLGAKSGFRGIMIGTVAGSLLQGGPYVVLPIGAALIKAGAGIGTIVAFMTGWSLWAIGRLPLEFGILGWKVALIRIGCTFFFPPLAGLLAQTIFGNVKLM